jgi:hypothetical protein
MSSVKISQLNLITQLNANTSNTLFVAVDIPSGVTGKFTGHTLAQGLYSNEVLNVGTNPVIYPGVVAQFSGNSNGAITYAQVNFQNFTANGSTDYVASTSDSNNSNSFIDMGISGKDYSDPVYYSAFKAYDGYLYVAGPTTTSYSGNLILGTASSNASIVFIAGGAMANNVVAKMTANGLSLNTQSYITYADSSIQSTAAAPYAYSNLIFAQSNASFLRTNTVFAQSNASFIQSNTVFTQSNASFAQANAGFLQANTGFTQANAGFLQANTANTLANNAYAQANGAFLQANTGFTQANLAYAQANAGFLQANTANTLANNAYAQANGAFLQANTGFTQANAAFLKANNALANTTGTFAGDLTITGNTYAQAVNTGNLQVVGTTNLTGNMNVSGAVSMNARVLLSNIAFPSTTAALTITGTANVGTPANDGYMIQVSGKDGVPSRIVNDSYGTGAYALFAGRSARGTVTSPTALQADDVISRVSSNGYGTTKYQTLGTGRIDFIAAENYTDANTGSKIEFWNCPIGSNTLTNIATFNGDSATFTGYIEPQKGFVYTTRVPAGNQTTIAINYATDSMIKANLVADLTVTHSNFLSGKVVELWLVNSGGTNRTVTHGITALNSTTNSTTFTIPATSCAHLKFFNTNGDLANTFVSVIHA